MGSSFEDQGDNQTARWRARQRALAAPREAIPVYTPKDYSLIRQLPGADDMPLTWEEWAKLFEASMKEHARARQFGYVRVRIRPDLFKAWLDANSQVASEWSRQTYAQELLDARQARRVAYEEQTRAREKAAWMAANAPPPPAPWAHRAIEACAIILLAIAIVSDALIALKHLPS
ncbi:hypothetical protein [Mesorhizobium sp. B1-1-8]|uniref:hypothetical protein n=1 Tax=Mesorhizobium sp. B1-1-8 TaxID=2589976 RepID=UPI00112B6CE1|nr:hypothetical protein [Mesorhizobium sp. B1-1-8]UCI05389.1 hypothetical protein FJ974_16165 [Mesorhizobium sp. B1-1-8]